MFCKINFHSCIISSQARVCAETGTLVMTEEKTLENVLRDGNQPHIKFNPQNPLSTFNALFSTLMRLSSGEYILRHSVKNEAFMQLYKAAEGAFQYTFNLHDTFKVYFICSF